MFTVRIFYGPKFVGEELIGRIVKVHDYAHAYRIASQIAGAIARQSIPPWMFDEKLVTWTVLEAVAA